MINKNIYILLFLLITLNLFASKNNIAKTAKVKASSGNLGFSFSGVNDGTTRVIDAREWVSKRGITFWGQIAYPWFELARGNPNEINKISTDFKYKN